jgi:hypothetical protein
MEMVRPLWRVEAPPVVILELENELAPWSTAACAMLLMGAIMGVVRRVSERRAVAAELAWLDADAERVSGEGSCLVGSRDNMLEGAKANAWLARQVTNRHFRDVMS